MNRESHSQSIVRGLRAQMRHDREEITLIVNLTLRDQTMTGDDRSDVYV